MDTTANAVNEGATGGVGIDVSSTDPNGTAGGGNVTFSLTNNAGGRFQIDATTGVVSVSDGSLLDGPTSHTITVQASDRTGGTSTKDFMIDVTNVAPTANDDSYNADVFTFLQVDVAINGPGVLGNDTDPAGATNDPLVVTTTGTIITAEGAATVTMNANGSFTYDATTSGTLLGLAEGATLDDSFNYDISDGDGGVDTATVTVTVTGADDNSVHIIDCFCGGSG